MLISEKIAIVTGGAQGLGQAISARLSREGAKVIIADTADKKGQALAGSIAASGRDVIYHHVNVAARLDVHNVVTVAAEHYGRIDILVNCAATIDDVPFFDLGEDELDRVLQTNVKGTFLITQAVAKQMVQQNQDEVEPPACSIINVGALSSRFGLEHNIAYAISRGGQTSLTKSLALALAQHNIRVNAIAPNAGPNDLIEGALLNEEDKRQLLSSTPLKRFAEPDEVAAAVAWLASDEASYITGTTLCLDGGRLVQGVATKQD